MTSTGPSMRDGTVRRGRNDLLAHRANNPYREYNFMLYIK